MAPNVQKAFELIDTAHAADPRRSQAGDPYELHYAKKMSSYLNLHTPNASPLLATAVRAQHFRRWEIPRDSYPRTKAGYFAWRTFLKKRQAELVRDICLQCEFSDAEATRVAALIAKEELRKGEGQGDTEAQVLEDCACLVFLVQDDQFDQFEADMRREQTAGESGGDDKIIGILRKTWVKMGKRGQDLALEMDLSARAKELVNKALAT